MDELTRAVNHPCGDLAEVPLNYLQDSVKDGGRQFPDEIRSKIETLLDLQSECGRYARIVIASRLPLLHYVDPTWTESRVIPLFSWANPEEAKGVWQGFLWAPRLTPSLLEALKPCFVDAFAYLEDLQDGSIYLARLLAAVAINSPESLSPTEMRRCLEKLQDDGRAEVARSFLDALEGAGQKASELWKNRVGPLIEKTWPRQISDKGPAASEYLAWAAAAAGESFPEAVSSLLDFLTPIEHGYGILEKLKDTAALERHPEESLELLDVLTGTNPPAHFGGLGEALQLIDHGMLGKDAERRFKTLQTRALETGC